MKFIPCWRQFLRFHRNSGWLLVIASFDREKKHILKNFDIFSTLQCHAVAYVTVDFMILHQTEYGLVFMARIAQICAFCCANDTEILIRIYILRRCEVSCLFAESANMVLRCSWFGASERISRIHQFRRHMCSLSCLGKFVVSKYSNKMRLDQANDDDIP